MTDFSKYISSVLLAFLVVSTPLKAQDIWISPDLPFLDFEIGENFYLIERGQDNSAFVASVYPQKATRPCPPYCIQPISLADEVTTVGEVELVNFIMDYVIPGEGYLIDARVETWYKSGTIPGAINLPFNMFAADENNPFLSQILLLLGGEQDADGAWAYPDAKSLLLFCNGPDCGQSPRAVRNLLKSGYPADKLYYYRGGMKTWTKFGFSILIPE
ncbi:MAG: rhodanese-like domain-containing protein [Paracoccaceae bacterium]